MKRKSTPKSLKQRKIRYYTKKYNFGASLIERLSNVSDNEFRAELIRQLGREAQMFEREMTEQDFVLPDNVHNYIKNAANRQSGASQETLNRIRIVLDKRRLAKQATYRTQTYTKNGEISMLTEEYDTGLRYNDYLGNSPNSLSRLLNKVTKSGNTVTNSFSYDLSAKLYLLVVNEKDDFDSLYDKASGYEDDEIKIKKGWDGTPETFGQFVKFKNFRLDEELSKDYLIDIMKDPYSSPGLHQNYIDTVNDTTYYKYAEDMGWSIDMTDQLEYLMNTSHAWNIAYQYANEDSERAKQNWENLGNRLAEFNTISPHSLDTYFSILAMIQNEDEYSSIMGEIDNFIEDAYNERN